MSLSALPAPYRRYPRTATLPSPAWFQSTYNSMELYFLHRYGISTTTFRHLGHDYDTHFPDTPRGRLGSWVWLDSLDVYGSRLCCAQQDVYEDGRSLQAYERRERRRQERREAWRVERETEEGKLAEDDVVVVKEEPMPLDGDVAMLDVEWNDNISKGRVKTTNISSGSQDEVDKNIPALCMSELDTLST